MLFKAYVYASSFWLLYNELHATTTLNSVAANDNGNQMLDRYHPGAYGSVHPNEWSCCKRTGHNKKGCTSVETDEIIEEHTSTDNSITSSTKSFDSDSM